jgi:WD40 repeat protein
VAVSPDGLLAFSGSRDRTVKVWDLERGKEIASLSGHTDAVWAVTVTPDGRRIISGSLDRTLMVWDLIRMEPGKRVRLEHVQTLDCGEYVLDVLASPNSRLAACVTHKGSLLVWNIDGGRLVTAFSGDNSLPSCAIAPDGVTFIVGGGSGQIHILRLEGLKGGVSSTESIM